MNEQADTKTPRLTLKCSGTGCFRPIKVDVLCKDYQDSYIFFDGDELFFDLKNKDMTITLEIKTK